MAARKAERFNPLSKQWEPVDFTTLKKGDRFRMWEPTGEPVYVDHIHELVAQGDAFWSEEAQNWGINARPE